MSDHAPGFSAELVEISRLYRVPGGDPLHAVCDVSLRIDPGSTTAITGASGSGKSTLLHLLGGMDRPTSGTISVDGRDLGNLRSSQLADYRRSVGFVFQRFHLLPTLTVRDNVLAPLLPMRGNGRLRGRVDDLIDQVGLGGRQHDLPAQLSGGQQQCVAIARALVNEPRLLLADEPTGNLNTSASEDILNLLLEAQQRTGATMLIATHNPQVATHCQRLLRLRDGRIVEDATLAPDTGDLLADISRLRP